MHYLNPTRTQPHQKNYGKNLQIRYMTENAVSKKFLVSRFNNYKISNNKHVIEQLHEIECILNNLKQHDMNIGETIIVSSIIVKLPPS